MLKTQHIELSGKDAGTTLVLTELPALAADRHARKILRAIDAPPEGGIVALVFRHLAQVRKLGDPGLRMLANFVDARIGDRLVKLDQADGAVRDWRNIEKIQQQALYLHVGFILDRETVEIPVAMVADKILRNAPDIAVTFCSPMIAAVIESKLATYRELETTLSTEDAFNMVELLNVRAVRDWHIQQQATA